MEKTGGSFDRDGTRLAHRRLGSGPPLIAVNGYAATSMDWDPGFLGALAERSEIVCPDNRGMGTSELGGEELSIELMAADALALMDELGIDSAPVLGWSMGGFVAQAIALQAPARVGALVLLGTDPGAGAEICSGEVWRSLTDHEGTPREQASRLISLLFPPAVAAPIDAKFGDLVAEARAALDHDALSGQERAMRDWHLEQDMEALATIPTLAAAGSEDVVIPPGNARLLADRAADSWLARFRGGGHAFMAQEPQRLADLIGAFLDRRTG